MSAMGTQAGESLKRAKLARSASRPQGGLTCNTDSEGNKLRKGRLGKRETKEKKGVFMKVEEVCECCGGKGQLTTDFADDWSSCRNCNGAGVFKYEEKKMNLMELKYAVDAAIELAAEYGESPENIIVSLQLDGPETQCVFSSNNVELHYDNNGCASGCVLTAFVETLHVSI